MRGRQQRGLDYTLLFRFLLSRVGQSSADVYREAAARLDRPDPIFWLVARTATEEHACVRIGRSSYYSGLRVDAEGRLALVDPSLSLPDVEPRCACCTYTLNGTPFTRRYRDRRDWESISPAMPTPGSAPGAAHRVTRTQPRTVSARLTEARWVTER